MISPLFNKIFRDKKNQPPPNHSFQLFSLSSGRVSHCSIFKFVFFLPVLIFPFLPPQKASFFLPLCQLASTLIFSLTPSISACTPSSFPPPSLPPSSPSHFPLSLSLFPWQAGDWHLQITRRQWHCVWPLSLISSLPPFCHLITVNPRPAPHCCIFNMPAPAPSRFLSLSLPLPPSLPHSPPLFHSPAADFTCSSVQYLECIRRLYTLPVQPSECFLSTASIITSSPLLPPLPALLLSVECRSIPHMDLSMSISLFAFHFSAVSLVFGKHVVRFTWSIGTNEGTVLSSFDDFAFRFEYFWPTVLTFSIFRSFYEKACSAVLCAFVQMQLLLKIKNILLSILINFKTMSCFLIINACLQC